MALIVSPVRKAVLADKPQIMEMCEENHRDNGQFALDPSKVEAMIDRAFNGGGAIIGVVGQHQIEGMLVLLISQFWYTSDWCLEDKVRDGPPSQLLPVSRHLGPRVSVVLWPMLVARIS